MCAEHLGDRLGLGIYRDDPGSLDLYYCLGRADLEFEIQPQLHPDGNGGALLDSGESRCFHGDLIDVGQEVREREDSHVAGGLRTLGTSRDRFDRYFGAWNGSAGRIRYGSDNLTCLRLRK